MIKENRVSKYLLYAIGEIILVVIVILIALQINNLNENRKDRIKEQEVLIQLQEEYQSNLLQLENKITLRNDIIQAATQALEYMDNPVNVNRDSLMSKISVLTNTPTFDPINNDLVSSGNLRLIKNKELNKRLMQWSTYTIQLAELEQEYQDNYRNILLPYIIKAGLGRDIDNSYWQLKSNFNFLMDKKDIEDKPNIGNSPKLIDLEIILNDKELEGLFSNAIYINYIANIESKSLHNRIEEILNLLNKEIKQSN
jgi:hypothetical protein